MTHPAISEYANAGCDIEPGTVIIQSFTYILDGLRQLDPLRAKKCLERDGRYVD